jgi:hypothetical protein
MSPKPAATTPKRAPAARRKLTSAGQNPEPVALPLPPQPTTFELAQLAARFIDPNGRHDQSYGRAVGMAMALWEEAQKMLTANAEYLQRRQFSQAHSMKVPKVEDWPQDSHQKPVVVSYVQGIEWMLPRDRKDRRDGLMLEFLQWVSQDAANNGSNGRGKWRELKDRGFEQHQFKRLAALLPEWRKEKRATANRANAAKKKAKKTKK